MTHSIVPGRVPAGATPEGDGILIGAGQVRVDVFIDFLCPFCRRFEQAAEPVLAGLVSDGLVRLAYHPMNFLDQASTTSYSTRATAASGCAADQGRFLQYAHELFAHQPAEGGPGLSDAVLTRLGQAAGLDETAFAACLARTAYLEWPTYVTARATEAGVNATPTVLVAGAPVSPQPHAITAAVSQARDAS
jgi:protein-disulfide isomerase